MFDDSQLVKHFPAMLKALRIRIAGLPESLPLASSDGPLARYFGDLEIDVEEGAKYTANRQWERAFQVSKEEQQNRIARGKYGMDLVCPFLEFYSRQEGIRDTDGVGMLARRIRDLNSILDGLPNATPGGSVSATNFFAPRTKPATRAPTVPAKRPADSDEEDANDKTYRPPRHTPVQSEEESENEITVLDGQPASKGKEKEQSTSKNPEITSKGNNNKPPTKRQKRKDNASDDEPEAVDDAPKTKVGRNPKKGRWAISNYIAPPTVHKNNKGEPVWRWECKWCSTYRTSPRTAGCVQYENETIELVVDSNFHSHARSCKRLPPTASFEAFEAAEVAEKAGTRPVPVPSIVSAFESQRENMTQFIQRGIENPAVVVTKRGFRKHLVEGIALDDHSFSFSEGKGMNALLRYLIPRGWKIPGRKTVKSDTMRLAGVLKERVDALILANLSKMSIAQDVWTSKNSVYAFCGVLGWLIDDSWILREFVIDLLPLDGDHSGEAIGRIVFRDLNKRGLVSRLLGAGGDNASTNGVVCETLCKLMWQISLHRSPEQMQVGCGGHVFNIVAQEIYFVLGVVDDSPDDVDYYEETRKFPLAYEANKDPQVVAETELMAREAQSSPDTAAVKAGRAADVADSDWEDSDGEADGSDEPDEESDLEANGGAEVAALDRQSDISKLSTATKSKKKPKRKSTIVDKLHETVVDINRSEIRRKRFRLITREACEPVNQNLVLIRGMKIRWNTTNAEIERGVRLELALIRWNQEIPRGLTGKKKKTAELKAKRQYLSPRDFKDLKKITDVMGVIQEATLDLSKKGVPTICKLLPLYKYVEKHLVASKAAISPANDTCNLRKAISAGLAKLRLHMEKALVSDYPLLGAVLHPAIRVSHFENSEDWDPALVVRAQTLLQHLYEVYKEEYDEKHPAPAKKTAGAAPSMSPSKGIWQRALAGPSSALTTRVQTELEVYFSGIYPMRKGDDDVLGWWRTYGMHFPILKLIARDILAVPGVSVAVERLFSSSKHTMSDARSSMAATTAANTVVTKELLNAGFGEGVDFLEGITIH